MPASIDLSARSALVTGAASGIGRAIAESFSVSSGRPSQRSADLNRAQARLAGMARPPECPDITA
jgi:NAD(P)-dependent dehydrogenase (short-subunit alcohol dehydrogenase family)